MCKIGIFCNILQFFAMFLKLCVSIIFYIIRFVHSYNNWDMVVEPLHYPTMFTTYTWKYTEFIFFSCLCLILPIVSILALKRSQRASTSIVLETKIDCTGNELSNMIKGILYSDLYSTAFSF